MKIATVIPLAKGIFKEELTYFTAKEIPNGSVVSIPVRNKKILGIVASSEEVYSQRSSIKEMDFNLKKILEIKDRAIFSPEFIESGIEVSKYFGTKSGIGLTSLIPASFREEYDKIAKFKTPGIQIKKTIIKPEKKLFQASLTDRISFYKTLVRASFAEKKSIFMVLPTEHDIVIFSEMLSRGIENFTFSIHGGLTAKKQIEKFKEIMESEHPVLIFGTGAFLSIPRNDIGTIIVEHESSNAYKSMNRPYLDFRFFAELFASKTNIKFILSDTLLRFETIGRKDIEFLSEVHPLSYRTEFQGKLEIINQNPKKENDTSNTLSTSKKSFKIFSEQAINQIRDTVSKKENVFVFSLRKGLATMTVCKDCNETINCDKCLSPVALYLSKDRKKRMFICNRCSTEKSPETTCKSCGSWNLMPLGIGTDTVFEELKKQFPENKIFKLDKEVVKTASGAEKITKEFEENKGSILVGTEMALFYIKDKLPLSIIASFDSFWSIPNFRINEKIIQLIISIISKTENKLIIQTKNEKDPAILAIKGENLLSFVREELENRKTLGYPPYKRFIKITFLGDKEETIKAKKHLKETFSEYEPHIFSGFVTKFKDKYITNALIKIDCQKWSLPEISTGSSLDKNLLEKLLSLPPNFSINVDPEDLL